MNLESITQDIKKLDQALKIVEKTENYLHFNKSNLIFELCEQINVLKDRRDKQIAFLQKIENK